MHNCDPRLKLVATIAYVVVLYCCGTAVGVALSILLLGALAAPLLRTVVTMFLYRAASALLQPIGDSPLARGMGDYAEVFSLLFIIQLSVGAMFLLLVAQLLTVANLTVMLR